jgi:hypothetical protein
MGKSPKMKLNGTDELNQVPLYEHGLASGRNDLIPQGTNVLRTPCVVVNAIPDH